MSPLLAQLGPEELGVVKLALSVAGALFVGLVTWVAVYMRRGRELVDEHVTEIAKLKLRVRYLERRNGIADDSEESQ